MIAVTDLPQIRPIIPLALAGNDTHTPSRAGTLPDGRVVHPGCMLMRVARRLASGYLETATGLAMADVNRLGVGKTGELVRVEVHKVTLSMKNAMSIKIEVETWYVRISHTGSEEKMGPSARRLTMNELFFYSQRST